jgi:hypothetical protein
MVSSDFLLAAQPAAREPPAKDAFSGRDLRRKEGPMTGTLHARLEESIEECIVSRRNYYMGLWAGKLFGFSGDELQAYAFGIVEADYEEAGHDDVMRKLVRDFFVRGSEIARMDIERELCRTYAVAARQVGATD